MAIIKWNPWGSDFPSFKEFEKLFLEDVNAEKISFIPEIDIYQTKDDVIVEVPLAGVDPEKVDISIENDMLNVKGRMDESTEIKDKNYYKREIKRGSFSRTILLPVEVQGNKASAEAENGLLKISIPKKKKVKSESVKIKIKKK